MREIKYIAIHCTASKQSTTVKELELHFRRIGWKKPGYHYVILPDGTIHQMLSVEKVSNGVKGWNSKLINIAYIALWLMSDSVFSFMTVSKYCVYLINSIYGIYMWNKLSKD